MAVIINEQEIRKAINILKTNDELFEIRIVYGNKMTYSGYFRGADSLMQALSNLREFKDCNIYMTLNCLNDACYDRSQRDKLLKTAKATTSDNDVIGYEWLMIDLDPKRPADTSSTDQQIQLAKDKGNEIYRFLRNVGFEKPVFAHSGNGVHLLYRIRLANTDDNKKLVEKSLKTLDMLFSTAEIEVDRRNFNPSRICKLYGTLAQKGLNTDERPHRMSCIIGNPQNVKPTDIKYLKKLCGYYPKEERPQRYNNYNPQRFDLDDWLNKYGIGYRKGDFSEGEKYILDCCPFDSNHKGKDACIFKLRSGAIGFNCFHNSCADKTWKDVRLLFEPDAYERRNQEYERRIYSKSNSSKPAAQKIEARDNKPIFYTAKDIYNMPQIEESFIRSGIIGIDKKLRGLKKGYVSVLSGLRASGKSSLISGIALDCIQGQNKVAVFSGELAPKNFMRWMNLQAAGKGYTEPTQFEGYYNVSRKHQGQIADWIGGNFYLYNNEYGNNYSAVIEQFSDLIDRHKLDLLMLDNLMAFDIRNLNDNKYDAQTEFVLSLQRLAKQKDIHILFVAHPRKALGFLRLDDISGTGDLSNAVDNAFICHRVNNDFVRLSQQMFGWKSDNELYGASNVIEIAKDRDGGNQDVFIPLYYEQETKRLKNAPEENKIYGWNNDDILKGGFERANIPDEIPF